MVFANYQTENNASSYLTTALSATWTTIIVNDGDIYPSTFPFLLTLEHYNDDGNVVKREIVKCVARDGNNMEVVRAVETCVADDTANPKTLQQNSWTFVAWDSVWLTITSWLIDDMQNEIERQANDLIEAQGLIDCANCRISEVEAFICCLS